MSDSPCVEDYLYTDSKGDKYGVFKLSPKECMRLQGVAENDIDKMMAINSNSRIYMQAGNSITVHVLCALFLQLGLSGLKRWNDMTQEEQYEVTMRGCNYTPHEGKE